MTDNVVPFAIPKKPRVFEKDPMPDQRKVAVLPIKAVFDLRLSHGALHVLAALCAYCNRAGITWVSQTRLAKELQVSQQAVAKQFKQLRELGYLETVKKGFKGERTDTLRVIFDPTVDAATAMAITSKVEDTRSPQIKQEQAMQAEEVDKEGQRRVAQAISKVLKQPNQRIKTMPKSGQTATVKSMREAVRKAQSKAQQPVDNHAYIHNLQVVNEDSLHSQLHSQPNHNLQVVHNSENTEKSNKVKDNINTRLTLVLHNLEIEKLIEGGISEARIQQHLDTLLPLYEAEGIKPSPSILIAGIKQLQADAP
jgi:DNA-binding transcriptional regulator YhcF (GntR family)